MFNKLNVFSRVLVPVKVVGWNFGDVPEVFSFETQVAYFITEEPCNPLLNFFGLSRFDKNASNFRPRVIVTLTKRAFIEECQKFDKCR